MKTKIIFLILSVGIFAMSCQKMTYDQQFASTYPISGEWTVMYEYPDKSTEGPYKLLIYNTSFSKDSVWLEDKDFAGFKFKAKVDIQSLTFSENFGTAKADTFKIQTGNIIKTDSISFDLTFKKKGDLYKIYGHRRTSYEEYMGL
jgi:hypothetical protein